MHHKLSEKDLVKKEAKCSVCGPIRLIKVNQGGRCPQSHARSNTREYLNNDGNVIKLSGIERQQKIEEYGNLCMICAVDISDSPQLDHCHDSGEFRGVLCKACNLGLGLFKDNPSTLIKAVFYLQRSVAATREIKVK